VNTPKGYVDTEYLQAMEKLLGRFKERTYSYMQIKTGDKVLDVGCGSGIDTIPLAQIVGSTGEVYGVDFDGTMVAEAEQRAEQAGLKAWVKHKQADATSLPFESDYFDSSRSERLFQHLHDPSLALNEMKRVTKPGGWIVVLDTDWGSASTDTIEIDLERRLTRFYTEHMLNNGYAGRQLYRLFKTHGLQEVANEVFPIVTTSYSIQRQVVGMNELEYEALAQGVITEDELRRILEDYEQADADGVFFCYGIQILMAGRKAGSL
jgi:ubiquinone/menaquinone biosynthesis C-methylase UbiE